AHYRVKLVIYPSAGPETFSYTLSEAWAAGVPVFVPPIGALAERVAGSGAGWVMTEAQWRDEQAMLERIAALVDDTNRAELDAARTRRAGDPSHAGRTHAVSRDAATGFERAEGAPQDVTLQNSAEWLARGRDHQQGGRAVDAMLCFRRAVREAPENIDARFH